MTATNDIYTFNDHPTMPATVRTVHDGSAPDGATPPVPRRGRRIRVIDILILIFAAVFIAAVSLWAYKTGMRLRSDLWRSTRTIRFDRDISYGFEFGNGALREAEHLANVPPYSDAGPDAHRLTIPQIIRGIVHYYDVVIDEHPNGDYKLDYPPMRLTAFTFFMHYTQHAHPAVTDFPKFPRHDIAHDTSLPQAEDITEPMLKFNALADAIAAVGIFFLVWLWIARGARGRPVSAARHAIPSGLVVFLVATAGFCFAITTLVTLPPRPAPIVNIAEVAPAIPNAQRPVNPNAPITGAVIHANIESPGMQTSYRIEYGPDQTYGKFSRSQQFSSQARQTPVQITLDKLSPGTTIHYRLIASTTAGVTKSQDNEFVVGGSPDVLPSRPVGGSIWPDWTVWLRLFVLFLTIVISARMLPALHRGWACGLVAALLVWFNPIVLVDSHVWPQWDVWILPFIVIAILLTSLDAWMLAGVVIGVGCLFKGQLLLGAPVLLLWPIFAGRFGAAMRFLGGASVAAGLVLSPWLLQSQTPWLWIASTMIAAGIVATVSYGRRYIWIKRRAVDPNSQSQTKARPIVEAVAGTPVPTRQKKISRAGLLIVAAIGLVSTAISLALLLRLWPIRSGVPTFLLVLLLAAVAIPPWLVRRRSLFAWGVCIFGASIWFAAFAFKGDFSWYKLGYEYGSVAEDKLAMGQKSFGNLPSLLTAKFGWNTLHEEAARIHIAILHFHYDHTISLDLKTLLVVIYAICTIICAAAAAVHARRKDPRLLIAVIAPWIIFPIIMGQMSERYLLWGSALSACLIAVSTGLTLLQMLIAILGAGMTMHQLLESDHTRWPALFNFFTQLYPDTGWLMLLIAAIYLWSAVVPSREKLIEVGQPLAPT